MPTPTIMRMSRSGWHPDKARQRQIFAVEIVTGIHAKAAADCGLGVRAVTAQCGILAGRAEGARIRFGIELDTVRADRTRRCHGMIVRIHEQTDPDVHRLEFGDHGLEPVPVTHQIPAVIRSGRARVIGHQCALVRPRLAHHAHELMEGVAFDIEFHPPAAHQLQQHADVTLANVAGIRTRVHRDAVRTGVQGEARDVFHAGNVERAGIAQ
jgi:hypothetical protein